jgi:hypothetical protein
VNLPGQAGPWKRPGTSRRINAATIFDYMDGAGELYVGYRFDHLDVFEYRADDASLRTILVELYWMRDADDAFGLLSTDWGGEPVTIGGGSPAPEASAAVAPPHRALYGAGLLRVWSGALYARILASRESPAAREAVLSIGRAVGAGPASPVPAILGALPDRAGERSPLRADRTCFFRSHLVLNSAYFLASGDILGLGPGVSAATTEYAPARPGTRPVRLVAVAYESADAASAALATFLRAYLPEAAASAATTGFAKVEHGFVGWSISGRGLALAFDADTGPGALGLARKAAARAASVIPGQR